MRSEREPVYRCGIFLHRDLFTVFGAEYLDAVLDAINRAGNFNFRINQGLDAFPYSLNCKLIRKIA